MRVVWIDDEHQIHASLGAALRASGLEILSAETGKHGIQLVQQRDPDVVLLDVKLKDLDGWEVCSRIRQISGVPIVMLSAAATSDSDIIRGLEMGADDYLTKPITTDVLQARLRALVRRSHHIAWRDTHKAYIDGRLVVDLRRKQLRVNGNYVSLSFMEFKLLEVLVHNAGEAVPMLELIEELWSGEVDNDDYARYVRIYVKRLREAIEPDTLNPRYIVTERGFGYRFVAQP